MPIPRLISKALDSCAALVPATGSAITITGVGAAAGATAAAPVLTVAATTILGLAGWELWKKWRKSDQLDTIEDALRYLIHKQGSLTGDIEKILLEDPELRDRLPPECHQPLRIFYELLKGADEKRETILREHHSALAALTTRCEQDFNDLATTLDLTRNDLSHLRNWARRIDSKLDDALALLRPRPRLFIPVLEQSNPADRLKYAAMRVGLHGRDPERALLDHFLKTDRQLAWWIVTGPGGMGKSRLALDCCLRHQEDWDVGFLSEDSTHGWWNDWTPDAPTLIVVDYLFRLAPDIAKAISKLEDHRRSLPHPVRFLLLEREARGPWWDRFSAAQTGVSESHVRDARHKTPAPELDLPPLETSAIRETFHDVFAKSDPPRLTSDSDLDRLAEAFTKVDPKRRPLFAAFAAEAVADTPTGAGPLRAWSPDDLAEAVVRRERERRWRHIIPDDEKRWRFENLILLATLTRGLSLKDALAAESLGGLLPKRSEFADGAAYRALVGAGAGDTLAPLEPDVVGEFFILQRLEELSERSDFLEVAWRLDPASVAMMTLMTLTDFARREGFQSARSTLGTPRVATPDQRFWWPILAADLCGLQDPQWEQRSQTAIATLQALRASSPDEPHLHFALAIALNNRGVRHGQLGDSARAIADYTAVVEMPDAPPDQKAQALNNRGVRHGQLGDSAREIADYTAVVEMPDAPPDQKAQALYNRGVTHGQLGDSARAIADYTAVVEMPDAPAEHKALAHAALASIYALLNDRPESLRHARAALAIEGLPDQLRKLMLELVERLAPDQDEPDEESTH